MSLDNPSHLGTRLQQDLRTSDDVPLLPKLRTLHISPTNCEGTFVRMADYIPFMTLLRLEELSVYFDAVQDSIESWAVPTAHKLAPGSLGITTLNLLGCFIGFNLAEMLIKSCRNLTSLSYSQLVSNLHDLGKVSGLEDLGSGPAFYEPLILNPRTCSSLLMSCADGLQVLQATFDNWDGGAIDYDMKFGGLHRLTSLVSLTIGAPNISAFSEMPKSLEFLTLQISTVRRCMGTLLPSGVSDFVRDSGHPYIQKWHRLKKIIFEASTGRWDEHTAFQDEIAGGTWHSHHPRCNEFCCVIWKTDGVDVTLRNCHLHHRCVMAWTIEI